MIRALVGVNEWLLPLPSLANTLTYKDQTFQTPNPRNHNVTVRCKGRLTTKIIKYRSPTKNNYIYLYQKYGTKNYISWSYPSNLKEKRAQLTVPAWRVGPVVWPWRSPGRPLRPCGWLRPLGAPNGASRPYPAGRWAQSSEYLRSVVKCLHVKTCGKHVDNVEKCYGILCLTCLFWIFLLL